MNNSKFLIDNQEVPQIPDNTEILRQMESKALKILEAITELQQSKAWGSLKELVFDDLVGRLERELSNEAKKTELDDRKLNRIAGQLQWATRYANLQLFYDQTRLELTRLRKLLYGTEQPESK